MSDQEPKDLKIVADASYMALCFIRQVSVAGPVVLLPELEENKY
jgi:hypothetical protein